MKYSFCDQYWNKYDSFETIKDSVVFIQVNMQETCKKHDYIRLSYLLYIYFYHVGEKEIIKQRIPPHK